MNRILYVLIGLLILVLAVLTIRSAIQNTHMDPMTAEKGANESLEGPHTESWKEFSSKDGHFAIMMPSIPHHVRDKSHEPRTKEMLIYDTYVAADDEGQGYMVNTITFPRTIDKVDVDNTLKNVVTDIIARNSENKLNNIKEGAFKAYKDYDFSYTNGDRTIRGKVFAVDDTVYMLGVIDRNTMHNSKEWDFFINSFEIISDKK